MSLAFFPFYSDRYESDTAHLSILEDGAYNRLLRLQWRTPGCKLPHDLPWIFRQMRAATEDERAAIVAVLDEFFTKGRGKIWSRRLLEIHMQVSVAHQAKKEAGKKGAAVKALKNKKTEESTAKADLKHIEPEPEPDSSSLQSEESKQQQQYAREAENSADSLHAEVMAAVGLTGSRIPTHWMPPAATIHVQRWVDDLGLTQAQIIKAARESRKRHEEPPNGPRALDGVMRSLAATIQAKPLTPAPAPPDRQAQPPPQPRNPTAAELSAWMDEARRKREQEDQTRETH